MSSCSYCAESVGKQAIWCACKAERYCSTKCRDYDCFRHGPVCNQQPRCAVCATEPALFTCGKCEAIHYCSVDCQGQNWRVHRPMCAQPVYGVQRKNIFYRFSKDSTSCVFVLTVPFRYLCHIHIRYLPSATDYEFFAVPNPLFTTAELKIVTQQCLEKLCVK